MKQARGTTPDDGDAASRIRLEEALALLSQAIAILDELNLDTIAGNVSLGYELGREHLHSIQNGGNPAA